MEVTHFIDFYFGECIALYQDLKNTIGLKNKIALAFMPPGWAPQSTENTAVAMRKAFLKGQEALGKTSKDYILEKWNTKNA